MLDINYSMLQTPTSEMNAATKISHVDLAIARGERALEMAEKYQAGATLQEIGDYYGITRERVRQIMTRELGVRRFDGGIARRAAEKRKAAGIKREQRFVAKYGMPEAEFRSVQEHRNSAGLRPIRIFQQQKRNADDRGIEWELTFAEWWSLWEQSGKWLERGRGHGYVMARHGDRGPYAVGNVKIIPGTENQSEYIRRYWKQVRGGERPPPQPRDGTPARKNPFWHLEPGSSVTVDASTRSLHSARNYAFVVAKQMDWTIKTKIRDDVLTVTRIA